MVDDVDPAELAAAGNRTAQLLVRGPRDDADEGMVARVVALADTEGLGVLADLWSHASSDSLAGALWRLYLLRTWVHGDPVQAAREFTAGRAYAPVHEVLAGVVDIAMITFIVHGVGSVRGGTVVLDASASSQFVSALLLAGARYERQTSVVRAAEDEYRAAYELSDLGLQ